MACSSSPTVNRLPRSSALRIASWRGLVSWNSSTISSWKRSAQETRRSAFSASSAPASSSRSSKSIDMWRRLSCSYASAKLHEQLVVEGHRAPRLGVLGACGLAQRKARAQLADGCAAGRRSTRSSSARCPLRRRQAHRRLRPRCPRSRSEPTRTRVAAARAAAVASRTRKSGSSPAGSGCERSNRPQKAWNVPTDAASVSRAAPRSPSSSRRARTRSRSSPAARSVNVIASTDAGFTPSSHTAATKRSTRTEVLPLPAAAESRIGSPRRATASRCSPVRASPAGAGGGCSS